MPIYEYRCENGHNFDAIQRMSDDPLTTCEVCGAPVQRVLHAPAVHFKGSGFYNTDYGTKKRARELKSAGEGTSKNGDGAKSRETKSSDASTSTSSSSDSKPSSNGGSGDKPAKSAAS
jgi:putative FmdB family regulatory protein